MAPRINNMTKKFHIVVVSNFNGNSYFEVLHDGGSIDSERYIRFCENAFDSLKLTNIQRHSIQSMHDNYNVDIVREVIEEDSCVSLGIIGRATGLKRSSIQTIIHKKLALKSVIGRWVLIS